MKTFYISLCVCVKSVNLMCVFTVNTSQFSLATRQALSRHLGPMATKSGQHKFESYSPGLNSS